ncbi:MAG: hypothetical protein LBK47_00735 [Prevotellaceae bacterium]|jgi:uncharacterized protein (TIGR02145 family)|nr:hypothetical protein [Prevotellaceae bacterium]
MKKQPLLSLLLLGLLFSTQTRAQVPVAYLTSTHVDLKNRFVYGELVYDAPDQCGRYELRFKTKTFRSGIFMDSARVKPISTAIINNADRYDVVVGDSAITNLTASGYQLKANLPSGVLPTDSVALFVEVYRLADKCLQCGVGGSDLTFTRKDIVAVCPYPNKDNDPTLLSCSRAATGAAQHWEAFVKDVRDCRIYRTVYIENSQQWWMAQNLDWRKAGKCYPTVNSCDTSGALYSWYEAITGKKEAGTVFNYPQIMNDNAGPPGVCPDGWHLPTDVEWMRLGVAVGSGADVEDAWVTGTQKQLMSFKNNNTDWYNLGGLQDMDNRHGFDWQATLFDGVRGVNNNPAIKFGAFWSAVNTAEDATVDTINRVVGMSTTSAWALNPLRADSSHGSKGNDYLPVRCVLGAGNAPTLVAVPTPQVTITDTCSGNIAVRVSNTNDYGSSYLFEVNGGTPQANTEPYFKISNATNEEAVYSVRVKAANAQGYWSQWSAAQNVTIYRLPSATLDYLCDNNQMAVFTATPNNGSGGGYTFAFGDGSSAYSAAAASQLALTTAEQTAYVKVMDSHGCISPQVNLAANIPTTPSITMPTQSYTNNGSFTGYTGSAMSGGSGIVHATAYAWASGTSTTATTPTTWGNSAAFSLPITTVAGTAATNYYAYYQTRDNKGCASAVAVSAVKSHTAIPANVTFCGNCGYSGTTPVDAWINSTFISGLLQNCSACYAAGATSCTDGKSNTTLAVNTGALSTSHPLVKVRNLGANYYVPGPSEDNNRISQNINASNSLTPCYRSSWFSSTGDSGLNCDLSGNGSFTSGSWTCPPTYDSNYADRGVPVFWRP